MINYKGIFADEDEEKQYYEGGAHFKYSHLVRALEKLKKEREKEETHNEIKNEFSKENNETLHSHRTDHSKLKIRAFNIDTITNQEIIMKTINDNKENDNNNGNENNKKAYSVNKKINPEKSKSCETKDLIDNREETIKRINDNKNNYFKQIYCINNKEKVNNNFNTLNNKHNNKNKTTTLHLKTNSIFKYKTKKIYDYLNIKNNMSNNLGNRNIHLNTNNSLSPDHHNNLSNIGKRTIKLNCNNVNNLINGELPKIDSRNYNYCCSLNKFSNHGRSNSYNINSIKSNNNNKNNNLTINMFNNVNSNSINRKLNNESRGKKDKIIFSSGLKNHKNDRVNTNLMTGTEKNNSKIRNLNMFLKDSSRNVGGKNKIGFGKMKGNLYMRNNGILVKPLLTETTVGNYKGI